MALFKKKTEDSEKETEKIETPVVKAEKKLEKKSKKKEVTEVKLGPVKSDVIIEPWITEKSHESMAENKYIFRVKQDADKKKIKSAIEGLYSVKVIGVNIINIPAKKRMYGRHEGTKSGYKKAIVKLKEGDKIELFKGV